MTTQELPQSLQMWLKMKQEKSDSVVDSVEHSILSTDYYTIYIHTDPLRSLNLVWWTQGVPAEFELFSASCMVIGDQMSHTFLFMRR